MGRVDLRLERTKGATTLLGCSRARLVRMFCAAWLISFAACASEPRAGGTSSAALGTGAAVVAAQRVAITAKTGRFEPTEVRLIQGVPAILEFTRVSEGTCLQALRMPWMEEPVELPLNEKVEIAVDTSMSGVFNYSCWMNMVSGEVTIQPAAD